MTNLFKGYKACADATFVKYIKGKEDDYNEGADIDADTLMNLALNKYTTRLENNEWNTLSAEQQKIVALTAKIEQLEKSKQQIKKKGDDKKNKKKNKKKEKGKDKKKQKDGDKREYPEWKLQAPPSPGKAVP